MTRGSLPKTLALLCALLCGCAALAAAAPPAEQKPADDQALADEILRSAGMDGGLCVHLGCGDGRLSVALSAKGKFLVHALAPDDATAAGAIRYIRAQGVYGQVWAERLAGKNLPYTENLVNLVVADDLPATDVWPSEILRVLRPKGVAYLGQSARAAPGAGQLTEEALKRRLADAGIADVEIIRRAGLWAKVVKPWPKDIDEWGHPRHGPDGNAASLDAQAGPPRRVRWVTGPMHEASNMVTAGGRLFYGGLIACDAFNGLRLWQRTLNPTPLRLGYPATAVAGSVLPVAVGDRLYVVADGKLQALDAATGRTVRAYETAATPQEVLCDSGLLIAVGPDAVEAFDAASGKLLWAHKAAEPGEAVTGEDGVYLLEGSVNRGQARSIVKLGRPAGHVLWRKSDYPWAGQVRRLAHNDGALVCEVSTFSNDRRGNGVHVLSDRTGELLWERLYEPGMAHYVQAKAVYAGGLLWVLQKGGWEGLDPASGQVKQRWRGPIAHCYPPAATPRYLLSGEMSLVDLRTGQADSNRISKGNCGRETGFMPANGLLYVGPKHCACYPMINGYAALAGARDGAPPATQPARSVPIVERPAGRPPAHLPTAPQRLAPDEWPMYRADMWRSASTVAPVPAKLDVLWTAKLGRRPGGPLLAQWRENAFIRSPVSSPVVACGLVVVAQGDAHRVVALDAQTGRAAWDFTANGRIDSPPTVHAGLCLFGTRSGWVYCLRAADGAMVWRMRVGPNDERIVSFGQLESPWPVAGSVLVVGGTAYFAAGRHPLADGGVLVLAVDPANAEVRWVCRIASLPVRNYYAGEALEFDAVDLLVAEADRGSPGPASASQPASRPATRPARQPGEPDYVAMSRWRFDPQTGQVNTVPTSGFGCYHAGGAPVMAPRGLWTYGPRMDYIPSGPRPGQPDYVGTRLRPLMAFRDGHLFATSDDKRVLFRRDFPPQGEGALPRFSAAGGPDPLAAFNDVWFQKREVVRRTNRSRRLAEGAAWTVSAFAGDRGEGAPPQSFAAGGPDPSVAAVVLAGDTVFVAGPNGRLAAFAAEDGAKRGERDLAPVVWDGLAAAYGKLYASTRDGEVICLGKRP